MVWLQAGAELSLDVQGRTSLIAVIWLCGLYCDHPRLPDLVPQNKDVFGDRIFLEVIRVK